MADAGRFIYFSFGGPHVVHMYLFVHFYGAIGGGKWCDIVEYKIISAHCNVLGLLNELWMNTNTICLSALIMPTLARFLSSQHKFPFPHFFHVAPASV